MDTKVEQHRLLNGRRSRSSPSQSSMSTTPRSEGTKSVSFSSQVSVFPSRVDDDLTIATTEELVAAEETESPSSSLFSGRWIEDFQESNETRGVAVVEVTDTSPLSIPNCNERRIKHSSNAIVSPPVINREPNREAGKKELLKRDEDPLQKNGYPHTLPPLLKSEATLSSVTPESVRGSDSCIESKLSPSYPSNITPASPLEHKFNFALLDSGLLDIDTDELYKDGDIGPISRNGKMWEQIVNTLRAMIIFVGYSTIVASKSCRENEKEVIAAKLAGAFLLCSLSLFATRDVRGKTGWKRLSEVVCSRKTLLLLCYIVVWSYIVTAATDVWYGRPLGGAHSCAKTRRPAAKSLLEPNVNKKNEWPLPIAPLDQEVNVEDVDVERCDFDKSSLSPLIPAPLTSNEELPTAESLADPLAITPETRPAIEPQVVPAMTDENRDLDNVVDVDPVDNNDILTEPSETVEHLSPETRQAQEPQVQPAAGDGADVSIPDETAVDTPHVGVEIGVVDISIVNAEYKSRVVESSDSVREAIDKTSRLDFISTREIMENYAPLKRDQGTVIEKQTMNPGDFVLNATNYVDEAEGGEGNETGTSPSSDKPSVDDVAKVNNMDEFVAECGEPPQIIPVEIEVESQESSDSAGFVTTKERDQEPASLPKSLLGPSTSLLVKGRIKDPRRNDVPVFTEKDLLALDCHQRTTEPDGASGATQDETNSRGSALRKVSRAATFLRRHFAGFLLGSNGTYKNQDMMDSLFEVWMRRLLA